MERLLYLYTECGYSIRQLSKIYKCDRNIIRRFLEKNKVTIKSKSEFLKNTSKFNDEDKDKVIQMYSNGKSIKEISEEFHVGTNSIRRILSNNNIKLRARYIDLNSYKDTIIEMYKKSESLKEIANFYKVHEDTVYRFLKNNGVEFISSIEKHKKDIIDSYINGISTKILAEKYNVTESGIYVLLRREKIKLRGCEVIPKDRYKEIVSQYTEGKSSIKLGKEYKVSASNIQTILKKEKVERRSPEESKRVYSLDISFFDSIDSEEKAYFLGFLYADGNVSSTSSAIRLGLKEDDRSILEKLNRIIKSDSPLYDYDGRSTLNIHSKHMKESVIKLGLVPRKTHILTFPEWLNPQLYPHFIRGYFDGDGSISHNSTTDTYTFSLAGTKEFLSRVQEILIKECTLNKVSITPVKTIHVLAYGGSKQLLRIKDFLYKNSTISLDRKKDIFDKIVVKENYIEDEKFKSAFEQYPTNKEISENLDVSYKTVYRRLKDLEMERGRREVILDEKEAIRLYIDEKMTAGDIGKIFDTSHTTILKILRRNGVDIRDSHGSLKMERILYPHKEEIVDLYTKQLKSAQYIANQFGVNQNTVIKFLSILNIPMRGKNDTIKSVLDGKKEEVIKLLKEGKRVYEIANHYNVTEAVIRKFFKRWKISSRNY